MAPFVGQRSSAVHPVTGASLVYEEYEYVAASQTAQVLGVTGGVGDILDTVIITPASLSPGVVTLLDGATSIPLFIGGATSLVDVKPITIKLGLRSVSGAWKITTGAAVSAIGIGRFTP